MHATWFVPMTMDRFRDRCIPEPNSGCWLWTGTMLWTGYGQVMINKKGKLAHRVAYELFVGAIPQGLTIDHLCRTRICVNPEHLQAVSQRVNTLRGIGPSAVNARKTHCPRGHELSSDNLYVNPQGKRTCKMCNRISARDFGRRQRAAQRMLS
jgi:hypothetical protein